MQKLFSKKVVALITTALLCAVSTVAITAQELKVEDIISKHLDSIGTKEKRDEVKNRMVLGTSEFESKFPTRKTAGKAAIVSDAKNLMFITSFASREYPFEKIGFFAEKVNLPFITAGNRSPLGAFVNDHKTMLSEGLFTGSISSTWNLLHTQSTKGKIDSAGTKKIDGRKTYVLNYYPNVNSSEYTIKLYFDAETFQHVRTEYRHTIAAKVSTFGKLGDQTGGFELSLIENFGDYKNENGLILPHTYQLKYMTTSNQGTYEFNWGVKISQYLFNQNLAPDFFSFDDK